MFTSPITAMSTVLHTGARQFDTNGQAVRDRACKRFDGRLHNEITNAKTVGEWEMLADQIIKAAQVGNYREPHGLRDSVRDRFLAECPFGPVKRRYHEAVGQTANAKKPEFSLIESLRKRDHHKGPPADRQQKIAKRRAEDQERRNAMRGGTGGGNPRKQKGEKK